MAERRHQTHRRRRSVEHLMKEILVTIPVTETHKKFLEEKASAGNYNCCFRYVPGKSVTDADAARANVIIGNIAPAEFCRCRRLYEAGGLAGKDCIDKCYRRLRSGRFRAHAGAGI